MSKPPKQYKKINWNKDYRENQEDYIIGDGSFGVLKYLPYKDEIFPCWSFGTYKSAKNSSKKIYKLFKYYLKTKDFPGADLARKYLRMGVSKGISYSEYNSKNTKGKKLKKEKWEDPEKYKIYKVFKKYHDKAIKNKRYIKMMNKHLA